MQNAECESQNQKATPPGVDSALGIRHSAFSHYRLRGKLHFKAVYEAKVKVSRGPLVIYSLTNGLSHARLGISMSRHVGTAPRRNRIKRLLREAFRTHNWQFPAGYDLVIVVRPHVPMMLAEYGQLFSQLVAQSHSKWKAKDKLI